MKAFPYCVVETWANELVELYRTYGEARSEADRLAVEEGGHYEVYRRVMPGEEI